MKNQNLKTKENNMKGITLVALVISIIVLLILATVSINLIINNGILDKAKTAVDKYSEGEIEEQIKLAHQEYQMHKFTDETPQTETEFLHSKLDSIYGAENTDITGTDPLIIKITNGGKMYACRLSSNGNTEQLIWIQDRTVVTNTKTGQILEVGDTVYYDSGVTSYEGTGDNQGKWGVLGAEDGKILIISKVNIGSRVSLNSKQDWLTEGTIKLNNACSSFKNSAYADSVRSVKIEDINRITGYIPATPVTYTYTMVDGNVKRNDQKNPSSQTSFEDINGTILTETNSIEVTANNYTYSLTQYFVTGSKIYNFIKGNGYYWLDSPSVDATTDNARWRYRFIYGDNVDWYSIWNSNGITGNNSTGVRAVVSIKSDIRLSGNSTDGWTIN